MQLSTKLTSRISWKRGNSHEEADDTSISWVATHFSPLFPGPSFRSNHESRKCVSSRATLRDLIVRRSHERTPLACLALVRWCALTLAINRADVWYDISIRSHFSIDYLFPFLEISSILQQDFTLYLWILSIWILWRFVRANVTFRLWSIVIFLFVLLWKFLYQLWEIVELQERSRVIFICSASGTYGGVLWMNIEVERREGDIYAYSVYNAIGVYRVQFSLLFYICNLMRDKGSSFFLALEEINRCWVFQSHRPWLTRTIDAGQIHRRLIISFPFFRVYIDGRRKMYYIRYLFNHPSPLMPNLLSERHAWAFPSIIETRFARTNDPLLFFLQSSF